MDRTRRRLPLLLLRVLGRLPPTDATGWTTGDFALGGLVPGQRVKLNVIAIEPAPPGYDPQQPVFFEAILDDYQLPTTPPENRCVELVY